MLKTIALIGFIQSLFGILLFVSKRPWHLSFIFISIWLAVIAVFLGASLLPFQVTEYFKPGIFPVLFLFGPLLYLYVNSLAVENFRLRPQILLHLIPYLAVSVHRSVIGPVPINSSFNNASAVSILYNNVYYGLMVFSMLVYWFLSLKLIISHRKNIPNHFSNYSAKNSLGWLISVLTLFLVLFLSDFFLSFIDRVFHSELRLFPTLSLNLTIFTFVMIYFGINQNAIYRFSPKNEDEQELARIQESREAKNHRPLLNDQQTEDLKKTIFQYLQSQKP